MFNVQTYVWSFFKANKIYRAPMKPSELFSKDKLKQGAHIHQTHDQPSPHMSCRSQPTATKCLVWNWHLKDSPLQERVLYKEFSRSLTDGYAMLMSS